jgi:hypothetical protein
VLTTPLPEEFAFFAVDFARDPDEVDFARDPDEVDFARDPPDELERLRA